MRHRPSILDDVGDPRRRTEVVLEHAEASGAVAHEVDAGHVDPHTARGIETGDTTVEVRRARDQPARYHPVGEDLARPVDVGQEPLEREDALAHPGFDDGPLVGVDDARDEIERKGTLLARVGERDALIVEGPVGRGAPDLEVIPREGPQHLVQGLVVGPGLVRPREHLVPGACRRVAVEEVSHRHLSTGCTFPVHFGRLNLRVGRFFDGSYITLATPSSAFRTFVGMDHQGVTSTPEPPRRRKPRAAGARKAAAALSVTAMLSLGGAIAWRDGQTASTSTARAAAASTRTSATGTASSASPASTTSSATASATSHTTTKGS